MGSEMCIRDSLNVATRYRRKYQVDDLEDADLWAFFKDNVQCSCHSCATISVTRIDERDETEYGMGLQLDASQQPEQLNPPITHVSSSDEDEQRVIHSDAMQLDHAVDPEISSAQAGSQSAEAAP